VYVAHCHLATNDEFESEVSTPKFDSNFETSVKVRSKYPRRDWSAKHHNLILADD